MENPDQDIIDRVDRGLVPVPQGVNVWVMLATAALAAIIVLSGLYGFRDLIVNYIVAQQPEQYDKVLTINAEMILAQQIQKVMTTSAGNAERTMRDNAEFSTRMGKILEKYSDRGYLVLPKGAVVTGPKNIDITVPVAKALGLNSVVEELDSNYKEKERSK